jgi:calcineurin-like phosphoesterase
MTGCRESVIGFDREGFIELFLGEKRRLPVATQGPVTFNAVLVDFDPTNREATRIQRIREEWNP